MTANVIAQKPRMSSSKTMDRFNGHPVRLQIFEGPLDLLLHLVKENRYDILDVPIAEITEQYIRYLRLMEMLDLDIAGEFLVMAATLLVMKSRMLLPPDEEEGKEGAESGPDPQTELALRLLEYEKFKEASESLRSLHEQRTQMFERPPNGNGNGNGHPNDVLLMKHISTFDLLKAFQDVLQRAMERPPALVRRDLFTVPQRIKTIEERLRQHPEGLTFWELCDDCEVKVEVVVTFLAVLELIRRARAIVHQEETFGEIRLRRAQESQRVNESMSQ
jgi:segregation and condensation protein A